MLSRDQILQADDLARERVDVPEWTPKGGDASNSFVYVREMTASEKDSFDAENYVLKGTETVINRQHFHARLLARTICDEHGKALFKLGEIQNLGNKSLKVMDRLAAVALRLSAMTKESQEELLGNSEGGRADVSPSGSPPSVESGTLTECSPA